MAGHDILIYEHTFERTLLSIDEIGRLVGIHPDMIQHFYTLGLIDPRVEKPQPLFDDSVLPRIDMIMRLRDDLHVDLSSCGLVLDLLERIIELENRLYYYERKYGK